MSIFRILTTALLTLTTSLGLNAQSCDASFAFTQNFVTAHFEVAYDLPEGFAFIGTNWNFGDGTLGTQPNPIHTFPYYGTFHCCVLVTSADEDGNTCETEYCQEIEITQPQPCSVNADFTVTLGADGQATFTPEFSAGDQTQVSEVSWNLGEGTEFNTVDAFQHTFAEPGTLSVCMSVNGESSSNTCVATACKEIEVAPFTCFAKPEVTAVASDCSVAASFELTTQGQSSITQISWTIDGEHVSEEALLSYELGDIEGATLCVEIEAESPGSTCHATDCVWVENQCNSTNLENAEAQTFSVYPNPAQDVVNVGATAGSWVQIFGMNGALVLEAQAPVVDCSMLPTGMYVISVQTGNQTLRQQLAIQ